MPGEPVIDLDGVEGSGTGEEGNGERPAAGPDLDERVTRLGRNRGD